MTEWCDCGHRVSAHAAPTTPDGQRGRCVHCRCQGVVQTIKWFADDKAEDGDDAA